MPLALPQMTLSGFCSGVQPLNSLSGPISVLALETIEIERDTLTLTSVSAFKSLIP